MKKTILSLFVFTCFILTTSCESDDDNTSSTTIEGTWKLTAWNVGESYDLNNDGTASVNLLDEMDCYTNETIVFTNGIATVMSTSYAEIYAELVVGSQTEYVYTIECEDEISNDPAEYVVNGNTVTITDTYEEDGETFEDVIIGSLSGNTLTFTVPEGFYVENDDFDTIVEQDLSLVYTKQ